VPFMLRIWLVFSLLGLSSGPAFAQKNVSVQGSGWQTGWCTGSNFWSCSRNIETMSEMDAERDGDRECWRLKGQLVHYSGFCNTYCSPGYAAPTEKNVYVSCRSNCRFDCRVKDKEKMGL